MSTAITWGKTDWDDLDGGVALVEDVATSEPWCAPTAEVGEVVSVEDRFAALVDRWQQEVAHISSVPRRIAHPAYLEIIGIGKPAIPLLLRELAREPNDWFQALRALTGTNPVKPEQRGNMRAMADAWVEWGQSKGYAA